MTETEAMLAQIKDLKRANKRWKITAGCALLVVVAIGLMSLEQYRAERAAVNRAVEEGKALVELAERQRVEARTNAMEARDAMDFMQQLLQEAEREKAGK